MGERLLITGCAKSGTRFIAHELRRRGLDCGHERAFGIDRHGEGRWEAEVSWLAAPYTPLDAYTVHLVRHPLLAIRSCALGERGWGAPAPTKTHEHFRWATRWLPEMLEADSDIEAAAWYWLGWNRLVTADERLRIEDVTRPVLARLAGRDVEMGPPTNSHQGEWRGLDWDDINVPGVRDLAQEYGYL